jgi:hypothetical protein
VSGEGLDIRVEIAPDAQPDGDPNGWTWLDVSAYRRKSADVEINYGRDDEASEVEAGDASLTFDMRDGLLSPRNPLSSLYRRIGTNTPIRFRLPLVTDTFTRTVAAGGWGTSDSGGTWSNGNGWNSVNGSGGLTALAAPNTAAEQTITNAAGLDIDVTYSVSLSAVTTGDRWTSAFILRKIDGNNMYRVHTDLKPGGVVTIRLSRRENGGNNDLVEDLTTSATYSANTKVWTRIVAEGGFLRAKVWSGLKSAEPTDWNIWSTLVRIEGGTFGFYQWRYSGNTNVGTLTSAVDDFTVDALLWAGNVPEWPPRWDRSGRDATMSVQAAGPMRRLNQGDDPIRSPLTRQLPRYSPAGYWPIEDDTGSTRAASAVANGLAAVPTNIEFGVEESELPGSRRMAKVTGTSSLLRGRARVSVATPTGFAGLIFWKHSSIPAADTVMVEWRTQNTVQRWQVIAGPGGFRLFAYDSDGTKIVDSGTVAYVIDPTKVFSIQLETTQSGSNIAWSLIWNQVGLLDFWAINGTVTGLVGRPTEFTIPGNTGNTGALFGHIWMGPATLPYVDATFLQISSGYVGELATDRIERLCAEQNVDLSIMLGDGEPLGAQRPGKFLDLLREAASGDLGVLYERAYALAYVPRVARYNTAVRMSLDWTGGDLSEAPQPTDDDQRLRNRWTVKRTNGSEATYEDAASIARHGAIGDSAEINIASDERLPLHAGWRTSLTTLDELRWPVIELDLIAHPELRPLFLSTRVGSRITVINPKAQVAGTTIDLIIEGVKQVIGRFKWDVTLTCSPAQVWDVAVWSDGVSRWGALTTTLQTARNASQTSWTITSVNPEDVWSTTASGYQWEVGGEFVTVQSIGAASGSGPYVQTATVIRAQNGVSKAQAAGTPIRMARPARWAL